jgi:hypothetical protein
VMRSNAAARASSVSRAGSPLMTSTVCFKCVVVSQGSVCQSHKAS